MAAYPPEWVHWESGPFAKQFHGREISRYSPMPPQGPSTTYRKDYPVPPLHWKHNPPPNHTNRPTPEFGHTTSHRADFTPHPLGNGAALLRPKPAQKFDPKLSAVTTARKDYKIPPLMKTTPFDAKSTFKPSDAPMGTTTMRADYLQWNLPGDRVKSGVPEPKPTKFHGSTTTRSDYNWPKEVAPPAVQPERPPHVVSKFGGTTEYRAAYEPVALPLGLPADIGIQIADKPYKSGGEGGQFDLFIKQGAPAPCENKRTYTTAADGQLSGAIIVVAKRPDMPHGIVVGQFELGGLKPEKVGVNKIEVKLKLSNEKTLMVAALYTNGKKEKALTFKANQAIRTVYQASNVPE